MNRWGKKRIGAAAFIIMGLSLFIGGCGSIGSGLVEIPPQEIALAEGPVSVSWMPAAPGVQVKKNAKAEIDYSNTANGYVMIRYPQETSQPLRVIIIAPDGISYTYTIYTSMDFEAFPLSGGDGAYQISVYEGAEGGKYAVVLSLTVDVALADEFAPFLRPNKYVNFKPDSETVKTAAKLTGDTDGLLETITTVYDYVTEALRYDKELAASVQNGYVPDVDAVLQRGKGICFDYAAVTAAMLRSRHIPTKLVVGYTGDLCHAWINVYSEETGWVDGVIFFDGESWRLMDPTFASGKAAKGNEKYVGDGTDYRAKYFY